MSAIEPVPRSGASRLHDTAPARLSIRGVRKRFGDNEVLRGVDLALAPGEIAVLVANGCGKSTLLRCAIGLLEPDAGEISLCGRDLASLRGHDLRHARREAAVVFQQIVPVSPGSSPTGPLSGRWR